MNFPVLSESEIGRFWGKINKNGSVPEHKKHLGACWNWTAGCFGTGYGALKIRSIRANYEAHRISFVLSGGIITPEKPHVLHSCDNRKCVNPSHLRAGNQKDNVDDMVLAGRQAKGDRQGLRAHPECAARGERHGSKVHPERVARGERSAISILTASDVQFIRQSHKSRQFNGRQLAKLFNVDVSTISCVVLRKTWKHVL